MSEALLRPLSRQRNLHLAQTDTANVLISAYVCTWIVVGFVATSDQFLHWFVIPVLFCGIVIGIDTVIWFRGRFNIFDPVGILGLLGFHFFFLAPLLHVYWDHWMGYVIPPPDWRDWLGSMAFLNFLGLLAYRISRNITLRRGQKQSKTVWRLDRQRFLTIGGIALLLTGVLQIWVYTRFGGILSYIQAATEIAPTSAFQGMGWIFMISESFPILALMAFAVYGDKKKSTKSWVILGLVFLVFLILKIFFGGLRGSRSNTVWGLFWAAGVIHLWIRPIPRQFILFGCAFLVSFMYFYAFFKSAGLEGFLRAFEGTAARVELTEGTGRSLEGAVLGDLGRSDVQAFLFYRLTRPESDYEYAWGETYLGAAILLIPRAIWPQRPLIGKGKSGTEAQYGMGSWIPGKWQSAKVYGLAGETMLNFGLVVVPFAYLIWGFFVSRVRHFMLALEAGDSRLILLPFLVNLCFVILIGDSDNILFFLVKDGAMPVAVLTFCSTKSVITESKILEPDL